MAPERRGAGRRPGRAREDVVEYAVYGARGELPELGGLDAVAGDGRVEVRADEVPDDWAERWKRFYFPGAGRRAAVRAASVGGAGAARRGGGGRDRPGRRVRDGHASDHAHVPRAAAGGARPGIVLRPRLRVGRAGDRGGEARVRAGGRRGRRPGGTRRDAAQRPRERRRGGGAPRRTCGGRPRRSRAPWRRTSPPGLCEAVARSWAERGERPGSRDRLRLPARGGGPGRGGARGRRASRSAAAWWPATGPHPGAYIPRP